MPLMLRSYDYPICIAIDLCQSRADYLVISPPVPKIADAPELREVSESSE